MATARKASKKRIVRDVSAHLRLTKEEVERFLIAAKKEGRTLSGWLRRLGEINS
jgi:hypothetical protein